MKPDKRREGSVSKSGLGCNTAENSCEPHVNVSFKAERNVPQGSSQGCQGVRNGGFVSSSSFESPDKQVRQEDPDRVSNPAANHSSGLPSAVFCSDSSLDPPHVRPDPRTAPSSTSSSWRRATDRVDEDGASFEASRSHRRGSQPLLQGPPSEYQEWLRLLKQAKTKKVTLQKFVGEKLKLTNVDHMTVAQLELQALRKIYEIAKPHRTDPIGFGKFSAKTYSEVMEEDKGYCNWIQKTAAENPTGCDPRLLRFSQWLEINSKEELIPEDQAPSKIKVPVSLSKATKKGSSSEATSSSPTTSTTSRETKMETMMAMMSDIKGEVDKIKEEQKPRKKGAKARDSESEASNFQMVMQTETD